MSEWDTSFGAAAFEIGVIEASGEEKDKGLVRVRLPFMPEGKDVLEGVEVLQLPGGPKDGSFLLPEKGARVLVGWMGAERRPVVLGSLNDPAGTLAQQCGKKGNAVKRLHTNSGAGLAWDEDAGQKSLSVETPGGLRLTLSDKANTVRVTGKGGKNVIEISEKDQKISVCAEKGIELAVGRNKLTIHTDGIELSGGKFTVKTDSIALNGKQKAAIEGANVTLSGSQTKVEAKVNLSLKANGIASLDGNLVKIK